MRRHRSTAPVVPAVLPQVVVTVAEGGGMRVTLDGAEQAGGPLTDTELGSLLASLAERVGGPIRVEVHDPDGTCYADILQPPPTAAPAPALETATDDGLSAEAPMLSAGGFLPGETVAVAPVAMTVTADRHGTITVALPGDLPAGGEVIVFGTVSATTLSSTPADR